MTIPNYRVLSDPWVDIASDILRPVGTRKFISNVLQLAKAFGEINRYHSKNLNELEFHTLQKRMTEVRKIVHRVEQQRKLVGKGPLIPWQHLEYLFSGEERKDMKR